MEKENYMRKVLGLLLLLCSCAAGGKFITSEKFQDIPVGITTQELVDRLGDPYAIRKTQAGTEVYEYTERVAAGGQLVEVRKYIFLIKNGKVKAKQMQTQTTPIFDQRNSYEMQTSDNDAEGLEE
jgi:hypothetical protein